MMFLHDKRMSGNDFRLSECGKGTFENHFLKTENDKRPGGNDKR